MSELTEKIILALCAALVAVLGLFVSQRIQRNHDSDVRKKLRLEKMTDMVSESLLWFHQLSNCHTIEQYKKAHPPIHNRQIVMIARLSFPSIVEPAKRYAQGCLDHYGFAASCFHPDIPASFGAQMALAVQKNPELKKDHENLISLRNALDDAIAAAGQKYVHL